MKEYSELIKERYEETSKVYSNNNETKSPSAETFFHSPMYKTIIGIMTKALKKFENGANKDYYKHVYITQGDYSKRKGYEGSIYNSMKEQASYIQDYVKNNSFARYSLLGVYSDLWDILIDTKWRIAFKKAFDYSVKSKDKTIVNGFRLMYVAIVLAFESISFKIVDFKYALYSGFSDEAAIKQIQNSNGPMIRNLILPVINIISLCKNTKNPVNILESIYNEEQKTLKSTESYTITRSEEGFFESFGNTIKSIGTSIGNTGVWQSISSFFKNHIKIIAVIGIVLFLLITAFFAARYIIYYIGIHKINLEKELELQSELIENNINELKNKMEKSSGSEKERYQRIIEKQLEIKNRIDNRIDNLSDDDNQANMAVDVVCNNDYESTENEVNESEAPAFDLEI